MDVRTPIALVSVGPHRPDVTAAVDALEREGQPVTLVCLDATKHAHEPALADVLHISPLPALVGALARNPLRVARALLRRTHAAIPLAQVLAHRGVTEVRGVDAHGKRLAAFVREMLPPASLDLPVDWSRLGAQQIGVRWISRRVNSIVAEVSIDGRRAIVKRHVSHAHGAAEDRWAHEVRVLESLRQAMGESVPRVLLADEDAGVVVMERAPGESVDWMFAGAGADRSLLPRLASALRNAGAWLAAMQNATRRSGDGRALLHEAIDTARRDVAALGMSARIVRRLEQLAPRANELDVTGHHDDYWPGNVFFDGERLTVIDFESFRDGLAAADVAFFLFRCELLRRRFSLPDLRARFLEGYGRPPAAATLQLLTITNALRFLAKGAGEELSLPQRMWLRRQVRVALRPELR